MIPSAQRPASATLPDRRAAAGARTPSGRARSWRAHPVALLTLPLLALSADVTAAEAVGTWSAVVGSVGVTRAGAGAAQPARVGDSVAVGELLEAGRDARAQFLLRDDTVVSLAPGAALRILQYAFDPATGRRTGVVTVSAGAARFTVAARRGSRFTIESPQATVAVDAADLLALVATEGTTVAVLDGSVKVKNRSNLIVPEVEVWTNQSTWVGEKAAPSHPAQLTPQQRKNFRNHVRLTR